MTTASPTRPRPRRRPAQKRQRRLPVVFHPGQLRHRPEFEWAFGRRVEHPDQVARSQVILDALQSSPRFEMRTPPRPLPLLELERTHSPALVRFLANACQLLGPDETFYPDLFPKRFSVAAPLNGLARAGAYCFDTATPLTRHTFEAARLSAASAAEGARLLLSGTATEAYALCRPPGHHAEADAFGGYCYFNNAAIAANRLRRRGRVSIIDFDFHHGNGTQSIFWRDSEVQVISIHGDPEVFYPQFSGYAAERGEGPGLGTTLNIPLPGDTDDAAYREVLDRQVLPALHAFQPASLILSAGFDTYHGDPVGEFKLSTPYYSELAGRFAALELPTLIVQEGGYHVDQLGENVRTFLDAFMDRREEAAGT